MESTEPRAKADGATARLRGLLHGLVGQKGIRHAVMVVERGDGSFRWADAAGEATPDGEPMRADTPFHIASIDKMCTAAVVMRLWEQGLVALDASIVEYLPRSLLEGLHRTKGVDRTPEITVRHLLGHSSGLADCFEDRRKGGRSLMERLFAEGDRGWTMEDLARIVRDDLTPHFPPADGSRPARARYSDTNYQLLIAVIEAVRGEPLHAVYDDLLFRPLELQQTWVQGHSRPASTTVPPATIWYQDQPLDLPEAIRSFPSVYSTCDDLLVFLRSLTGGNLFEDMATYSMMRRHWNRLGIPRNAAALRAPGWPIEYGLGLMRFRLPRYLNRGRTMPEVIGHTGSTGSWLFHCPELDLMLAGTVDQATAGAVPYRVVPRLLRILS
jgi:D-alanyl-D-alanine carboxypeptidase